MTLIYVFLVIVSLVMAVVMRSYIWDMMNYRGPLESEYDEFQRTVEDYAKALELDVDGALARYFKGSANLMIGKKRKARVEFLRAQQLGKHIPQKAFDLCM